MKLPQQTYFLAILASPSVCHSDFYCVGVSGPLQSVHRPWPMAWDVIYFMEAILKNSWRLVTIETFIRVKRRHDLYQKSKVCFKKSIFAKCTQLTPPLKFCKFISP